MIHGGLAPLVLVMFANDTVFVGWQLGHRPGSSAERSTSRHDGARLEEAVTEQLGATPRSAVSATPPSGPRWQRVSSERRGVQRTRNGATLRRRYSEVVVSGERGGGGGGRLRGGWEEVEVVRDGHYGHRLVVDGGRRVSLSAQPLRQEAPLPLESLDGLQRLRLVVLSQQQLLLKHAAHTYIGQLYRSLI